MTRTRTHTAPHTGARARAHGAERAQFLTELGQALGLVEQLLDEHRHAGRPTPEAIAGAARGLHLIKGTAGMVGLDELAAEAHTAEEALLGAGEAGWSTAGLEASLLRLCRIAAETNDSSDVALCDGRDRDLEVALGRLASEVAAERGAAVRVTLEGDVWATGLAAPTAQLVANAAAHGIEPHAARIAAGKPPYGRITVRAWAQGADTVVEVVDDGAGFDECALRLAAARRGITDDGTPAAELAFVHGVTTRSTVALGAGRGVGLDLVRSLVGAANGRIDVMTAPGVGSTVRLSVPC